MKASQFMRSLLYGASAPVLSFLLRGDLVKVPSEDFAGYFG